MAAMRKRAESMAELEALQGRMFDRQASRRSIEAYQPRPTDVVITPYGKSGTTWTQQIFHTLRTRGDMDFDDISRVVPWIETAEHLGIDINAEQRANPRGFKSHLGYESLPRGAKYIVVIRDPLDAAYSAFKFSEGWFLEPGSVSPAEYVLTNLPNAGYHKHFISWWPHRDDEDVLYLVYEHMRQDAVGTIRRIADFAQIPLDDGLLELTLEHSSLSFMQAHKDRFDDAMMRELSEREVLPAGSDSAKVRAGKVAEFGWDDEVVEAFALAWQEHIQPVTGYATYAELIDSLADR